MVERGNGVIASNYIVSSYETHAQIHGISLHNVTINKQQDKHNCVVDNKSHTHTSRHSLIMADLRSRCGHYIFAL